MSDKVVGRVTPATGGPDRSVKIEAPERATKIEGTKRFFEQQSATYWRQLAVEAQERMKIMDAQLRDVRVAADEARARMTKYKQRLENAQDQVNTLQARLIAVSAAHDALREQAAQQEHALGDRLARQDVVKWKVHEFRQSILDGPIWELFAEFCREVGPVVPADEGDQS